MASYGLASNDPPGGGPTPSGAVHGGAGSLRSVQLAALLLLLVALAAALRWYRRSERFEVRSEPGVVDGYTPWGRRRSVHEQVNRLYSTADVDPLVVGQFYRHSDDARRVYTQRTAGIPLSEFSSSGLPGDIGYDVGPYGLAEYEGRRIGHDDGIPERWALPDTPVRWYRPVGEDYLGRDGHAVHNPSALVPFTEPDHEPMVG